MLHPPSASVLCGGQGPGTGGKLGYKLKCTELEEAADVFWADPGAGQHFYGPSVAGLCLRRPGSPASPYTLPNGPKPCLNYLD